MTVHETLATGVKTKGDPPRGVRPLGHWTVLTDQQYAREGFMWLQRQGYTLREIAEKYGQPYEVVRKALYDDVVRS